MLSVVEINALTPYARENCFDEFVSEISNKFISLENYKNSEENRDNIIKKILNIYETNVCFKCNYKNKKRINSNVHVDIEDIITDIEEFNFDLINEIAYYDFYANYIYDDTQYNELFAAAKYDADAASLLNEYVDETVSEITNEWCEYFYPDATEEYYLSRTVLNDNGYSYTDGGLYGNCNEDMSDKIVDHFSKNENVRTLFNNCQNILMEDLYLDQFQNALWLDPGSVIKNRDLLLRTRIIEK